MKCSKCGNEIIAEDDYREYENANVRWAHHLVCPSGAERSGVLQGCPPSANCSAGARADALPNSMISSVVPREKAVRETRKYLISEERILTVSNHISEDEFGAFTKKEAIETVKYFRDEFDNLWRKTVAERTAIAAELLRVANQTLMESCLTDARQRSDERALARNDRTQRSGGQHRFDCWEITKKPDA